MPCNCCEITDNQFNEDSAKSDIKEYRKRGPAKQTQLILDAVRSLKLKDVELLDIGGGVGAIHHELLKDVASKAMHVDASSAYLKEAQEESAKQGNAERVQFLHADFTEAAKDIPQADVVTLDRVVCCYPDYRKLLTNVSEHSRKAIALTYPRETWYLKFGMGMANFIQRLRHDPFRIFIHPIRAIDELLNRQGFQRISMKRLLIWEMALYQRV